MRCPSCQTVNPSHAKFCLECGTRLIICPQCGTTIMPQAKFCIECGLALQPSTTISNTTIPTLHTALQPNNAVVPSSVVEASGQIIEHMPTPALYASPEERRVVTIIFADITGSTPLADRLDPEDMRTILTGYFTVMAEQIHKHDGTVEKYIGDAIMAIFGLPIAHEDDPDRAIRAAIDMQTALERFNDQRQTYDPATIRLQMRIGINTGEVAAPTNASIRGQDFLITGDAVNIAARLQQAAAPDTILVGERTYYSARGAFEFRPLAPLTLKGKAEPIAGYVVGCSICDDNSLIPQHPRGIEELQSPLVGRMLELTLLHASYARVQAERRPHLITILGVPGVGKSRLVREFISREYERVKSASSIGARISPLVLRGRCPPYGEGITYWPLIEIVRTLLQAQDAESNFSLRERLIEFTKHVLTQAKRQEPLDEIVEPLLRHIGHSLSGQIEGIEPDTHDHQLLAEPQLATRTSNLRQSGAQNALLRAWRILVEALADRQPLIVVIDDLHWADEALLNLLEYLADRLTAAPVLFLCPARPDFFEQRRNWGGGHRNFTTIELEALSWDESSELVDTILNTNDLPEALRYTILSRAEGNPFFVEEIIRMLIDRDVLVPTQDQKSGKMSWSIGYRNNALLDELSTPGEPPEDTLLEQHYLLPLPYVPDTIQGVLAARVDLLQPTEKLMLQYAAITGRTFWLSALLELAENMDIETIQEALSFLLQRDFIVETEKQASKLEENDRVFHFKHILIRDVVYSHIPRQRRSREHARLAYWLEAREAQQESVTVELLAHHYQQALATWSTRSPIEIIEFPYSKQQHPVRLTRNKLRQRAVHYLGLAGDQAMLSYYTLRAIRAYSDALELLRESDTDALTRCKMLKKLGDAYAQRTNLDDAWCYYRQALNLITDGNTDIQTLSTLSSEHSGYALMLYEHLALLATRWLGHFDTFPDTQEVHRYIIAGRSMAEQQPLSREYIVFLTYQTLWYVRQLESVPAEQKISLLEHALQHGSQALHQAEALDDPRTISLALDGVGFVYEMYHLYDRALEMQKRRLVLESRLTARDELFDLYISYGWTNTRVADYQAALHWFGLAWRMAQTTESPTMLRMSMVKRMHVWQYWNRWDEAEQTAHENLHLIEKYQLDERRQYWALETLARIAYHRGNQEDGDHYTKRCRRILDLMAEQVNEREKKKIMLRIRVLHYANGDLERAIAEYREYLHHSEPLPDPETLGTLADLLVQANKEPEMQAELCERAMMISRRSGARKSMMVALRARGALYTRNQSWGEAEQDLRQALGLCDELDLPWEQGHSLCALGKLFQQRSLSWENEQAYQADMGRARHHFELALGFYEALRATPMIQQVQRYLETLNNFPDRERISS